MRPSNGNPENLKILDEAVERFFERVYSDDLDAVEEEYFFGEDGEYFVEINVAGTIPMRVVLELKDEEE